MESDEYFTIRYLTKSRQKSRSRSNSMNRLDGNVNTRRFSNSFCNADTIDLSMSHLSKELNLLGFSFVYHSGSGPKDSDIINLINASYELIQYQKRNMKIHEELENKNLRITSDLDSLHSTNNRLKDSISQFQRNIANLQEQERQLNNQNKTLHQKLKAKLEEVKRLQSVQQQRETQALHDARKKEREMEKLREKLQQLLSDRSKDRHSGMDVINLLQRKDGKRGKWKTNTLENKQEDEMYQMIIKDFEERHRLIMEENINLRQLLADMNKELTLISNCINPNLTKDPKSESNDFETYHPEGQFNMPFELMHEKVKKSMKDKFSLLRQRFLEITKGGKNTTAKNTSVSTNSSSVPIARKVLEQDFTQSGLSPSAQ